MSVMKLILALTDLGYSWLFGVSKAKTQKMET